ncbi:prolipoprotein diacylglyceryl transferase [Hydrogenimonas thermophila]|uniref:prolipoprotein diacylglyceryl transferase n=1 Tax=Hydrogenimonas thermophila TaxID=223786 RepID=UPI002936F044|nr:prolipoprotein diacylglyceryl transferase [Hydrogenimonas thermophila]WOE69479.1 prolipoprotein diacylglyceryl transferase [Hydrogenimonas thermophila]WOE71990.1 prolipoprotein diacylglyceryl transferase [Hydrogenimonas thermophila]
MTYWQHIYEHFDPIAFSIGPFNVHWYGIMYVLALLTALYAAGWYVKNDKYPVEDKMLESYFIYVEIGVILGARLGYILFYDPHTSYYLTHPWQIFNPFQGGTFTGISGMSYHGAVIGFLIATWIFVRKTKTSFWMWMDLVALSVPVGYVFGRIGNFLNQELVGRATDVPWGIYVNQTLRHPSQLYEAFLEGILVAAILFFYRKRQRFEGELIALYAILYGTARFVAEFWREPDIQLGYICCGWVTMGQLLSFAMIVAGGIGYKMLAKRGKPILLKSQ